MEKETRDIIRIDEELCDGCGLCVPACAEKAIQIIDGKAKLIGEKFCDGLGACLGDCPQGALSIEKRDVEPFDEEAVEELILSQQKSKKGSPCSSGCEVLMEREVDKGGEKEGDVIKSAPSALRHWPVQLKLISAGAKFLEHSHWLIAADCAPFAFADFHKRFIEGKSLLIGCPKLDDLSYYYKKLIELIKEHTPETITVVIMEVPCCSGFAQLVSKVIEDLDLDIKRETIVLSLRGEIKSKTCS